MTYDEFKDYIAGHLWKTGDSVVMDALDIIVKTAEAELNRTFKVEDRVTVVDLSVTSSQIPLPDDYRELRHLSSPTSGEMKYNIPSDYANKKATQCLTGKDFTVANKTIRLPWYTGPETMECWYYRNLTPFATIVDSDTNWIVDDYLDVYLYCVLKHTAPFLREDERIQVWETMFGTAFGTAMSESLDRKFAGSPLKMKFRKGIR